MTATPKILLLCHNRMAIPALQYLHREQALVTVAVPDLYDFVHQPFLELSRQIGVPFVTLSRDTYRTELARITEALQPDAVFVIAFPWMLPVSNLPACPGGWLNFHGGLLPQMRGSDPMFHVLRNAIYHTGVTVHRMDDGMDTGPVLLQEPIETGPDTTHGMLSSQIAFACEKLARTLLTGIRNGAWPEAVPQQETDAGYLPKPGMEDTFINWETMTAAQIRALVNACNPQLKGATAIFSNWKFGITHVTEINLTGDDGSIRPGTILYADPQQGMIVYTMDGKGLRVDIAYTEEGYLPGYRLAMFGLAAGVQLINLPPVAAATVA